MKARELLCTVALASLLHLCGCASTQTHTPQPAAKKPRVTEPEIVALPDGRRMAVHHFGDPHGSPLLIFHGWPSDGSLGALLDEAARRHHLHIFAPDRPGIGRSDPLPHRTLADWPADVRAITVHFGLKKFALLGISGGGPYALATARAMPGRVTACAIVSGAPPLDNPDDANMMPADFRKLLRIHHSHPGMLRFGFRTAHSIIPLLPEAWLHPSMRKLVPPDRAMYDDPQIKAILTGSGRRSFSGSRDGVHDDAILYTVPWSFDPAEISTTVEFWHGEQDIIFPPPLARKLAARIPHARIHIIPHEGHYSLPVNRADAILAPLAAH